MTVVKVVGAHLLFTLRLIQRIAWWLKYRARKLRTMAKPKLDPRKNPYAVLLAKLSGIKAPPKARQAVQQYSHENDQSTIKAVVESRWLAEQLAGRVPADKTFLSAFRESITREFFDALDDDERKALGERAKEEAVRAKEAYENTLKNPALKAPEARQE